jgi:hypothetical protein
LKTNAKTPINELAAEICQLIANVSKEQRLSFMDENYVLCISCDHPEAEPRDVADLFNKKQMEQRNAEALTGERVIRIYKRCGLSHISNRKKLFSDVSQLADIAAGIIDGDMPVARVMEITCTLEGHQQKKRLVLMLAVSRCGQIRETEAFNHAMRMNKDFAAECLDAILYAISEKNEQPMEMEAAQRLTPEECQQKINSLEIECGRANSLLRRLQESFDTQLADSKAEEQVRFMSKLNSEKYGFILDLLVSAQKGFKSLRSQRADIPYELKDVQTLVRRLLEFVEDCDVTQMMAVGTRMYVHATDIEGYIFDGKPFADEGEIKHVEVISPGWQIVGQDIVISYPRLKEMVEA